MPSCPGTMTNPLAGQPISPPRLSAAFRQRCEALATEARYALGLKAFQPLPARQLAAHYQVLLLTPLDLAADAGAAVAQVLSQPGWSAALISRQPPVILHHPLHSAARQEANLMHELAHLLLGHPLPAFDPATWPATLDKQHEREADYLGSCLQIPRRGLEWAQQRGFTRQQTAAHFGASLQLVSWRCNATGITILSAALDA
ncbi:ImmA/IrrE family metallo-endopeptidase [Hymenobacter sp. BRD128]|uniref:ImmA/IrrE family metallo-endopeptidase n=1 Tax=Hymenobacter sp. BRD128 TaxID=2675878 RepID=UPI0015672CBE|nr:ImmA/IrrE family metallo-endopeptidase [Hymenobacter sp. BRD128]QKG56215.1 ImmA/IrrE family metallo-endopeptidase [Hymenobacter sp. BRD128]